MKKFNFYILLFLFLTNFTFANNTLDLKNIIHKEEINISNINLSDFLFYLSQENKIDIIAENSIRTKNINFSISKNSSLYKILNILCKNNHLKFEKEKDYIFISTKKITQEGYGNIIGKISSSEYKKKLSGVKITLLDNISSPYYSDLKGNFEFNNIPYGIYFIRAEKIGYKIEGEIIEVNDKNNYLEIFLEKEERRKKSNLYTTLEKNNYDSFIIEKIKLSDINTINEDLLKKSLKKGIIFAKNKEKNILYISGKKNKVLKIKKYFENLDNHNKQVRITAQILDVTENLFENLGFSWIYGGNLNNQKKKLTANVLSEPTINGISPLFSSVFNLIKSFNNDKDFLQMSFNMLQGTQDLTITAMPSIVTTNGKTSCFKITEEKIVGQEKTENSDNGKTVYTPIFKEAGIVLNVTPEIMQDENIILTISLETSDFKMDNYIKKNNDNNYGGSKISRNIETTVKLKNGDTVFIGGLKKGIIQNSNSSVPYVSSIPIIGSLFKNSSKKNEITDLYIRLKIDIIKDGDFSEINSKGF